MKCDNMERGCQWVGTVRILEKHVGVCQFTLVPCPKKCKDDNGILKITRRDLQQHLEKECSNRDYSCEHCGLKGTYATTLDHYNKCQKIIISCTNKGCTMEVERMKIKNHLSEECEHTLISCKYMSIGCDVKLKRKDMRAHEQDDKAHLNKTVDTLVKLRKKMAKLQNDNNMLREETAKLMKENSDRLEAKMQNEMTKLSRDKEDQLEDKVAKSEVNMRAEMAVLSREKDDKLEDKVTRSQFKMQKEMATLSRVVETVVEYSGKLAIRSNANSCRLVDEMQAMQAMQEIKDKEMKKTCTSLNKTCTSLNSKMKYIVVAVVILLGAVGYSLYSHYDLQKTLQQQKSIQATLQQKVDDLQVTLQQQKNLQVTLQQQVDDLQGTLQQQKNLQGTLQQQVDDLQGTLQQSNDSPQVSYPLVRLAAAN